MDTLNRLFLSEQASTSPLQQQYETLLAEQPNLRRRDAAQALAQPEAALIDQKCGVSSVRLNNNFSDIIYALPSLGYIMTLTRNENAVHERKGCYDNVSVKGPMGLVITDDRKIDLRIIVSRWHSGFAVREETKNGARFSLQFFDKTGTAIQKIYLQAESDLQAYEALVVEFKAVDDTDTAIAFSEENEETVYSLDEDVDRDALVEQWQKMSNVHQFFGILSKHNISREQAFRLVGAPLAQQFDPSQMTQLLTDIAKTDLSIMCFVGNRGNIQIHTGAIETVKIVGPWLNILDPEFNLHLLHENVANAWLIRKPSADGNITSLELYDEKGETIAQFFGERREGNPENAQWRQFAEGILTNKAVA